MPAGYNDNDNDGNSRDKDVQSNDFTTTWKIYSILFFQIGSRGPRAETRGKPRPIKFILKKRGLELIFPTHFLYHFWREISLTLHFINWQNFIFWLTLLRKMLVNMCIVIICFPVDDVIIFKINFSFFITPFSYMT